MKFRYLPKRTQYLVGSYLFAFLICFLAIHSLRNQNISQANLATALQDQLDPTIVKNFAQQHGVSFGTSYGFRDGSVPATPPRPADFLERISPYFNFYQIPLSFSTSEPQQGVLNFKNTDVLTAFAQSKGATIKGHTLLYPATTPQWLSSDGGYTVKTNTDGTPMFTTDELEAIAKNHVEGVVTHFKEKFPGAITQWQVVNETTCNTVSIISDPTKCYTDVGLKKYLWTAIHKPGSTDPTDYIQLAFQWAHEADPSAKLILTDSASSPGKPLDTMYATVKHLIDAGTPISGFGMQGHTSLFWPYSANQLVDQINRFTDLGIEFQITEFDAIMSKAAGVTSAAQTAALPATDENLAQQARMYRLFFDACLHARHCTNFTAFTAWDPVSWLFAHPEIPNPETFSPGLLDTDFNQKPAYTYLVDEATNYDKRTVPITYPTYLVMDHQDPKATFTFDGGMELQTNGNMTENFVFPTSKLYSVVVSAYGASSGGVWPSMSILVDGKVVKTITVDSSDYKEYTAEIQLDAGTHMVGAALTNAETGSIKNRILVINSVGARNSGASKTYNTTPDDSTTINNPSAGPLSIPDHTAPTLSLAGSSSVTLYVGDTFTDPGATALDNKDGDITSRVTTTGSVNTNVAGTYTVTYQVSDQAGNNTSAMRTVIVVTPTPPPSAGGGLISSPSGVTVTTSQSPDSPVSNTIQFHVEQTPATVPHMVAQYVPSATKKPIQSKQTTKPSAPVGTQPTVVPEALAVTKHIVSIDYTLNDNLIHTTTVFPETWTFDTKPLSDNAYVLKTTYYYQDHTTDTSITIFTIKNGRTLIESIGHWIGGVWEKVLGWF